MRRGVAAIGLVLAVIFLAGCSSQGHADPAGGTSSGEAVGLEPQEANYTDPLHGAPLTSVSRANLALSFQVVSPPAKWGTPSMSVSPSNPGVDPSTVKMAFVFTGTEFGTLDVIEGRPQESNWTAFINGVVEAGKQPGAMGSSEIVSLADGSSALITTSADGQVSDIQWQSPSSRLEYAIQGSALNRDAAIGQANAFIQSKPYQASP